MFEIEIARLLKPEWVLAVGFFLCTFFRLPELNSPASTGLRKVTTGIRDVVTFLSNFPSLSVWILTKFSKHGQEIEVCASGLVDKGHDENRSRTL